MFWLRIIDTSNEKGWEFLIYFINISIDFDSRFQVLKGEKTGFLKLSINKAFSFLKNKEISAKKSLYSELLKKGSFSQENVENL